MSNEFMPCRTASTVGQPMWVAPLFMGVKMRILMSLLVIAAFFTCLIFISDITFSHSGRTDRDGGHLESATGKYHNHDTSSTQKTDRRYLLLVETDRAAAENEINLPLYENYDLTHLSTTTAEGEIIYTIVMVRK